MLWIWSTWTASRFSTGDIQHIFVHATCLWKLWSSTWCKFSPLRSDHDVANKAEYVQYLEVNQVTVFFFIETAQKITFHNK